MGKNVLKILVLNNLLYRIFYKKFHFITIFFLIFYWFNECSFFRREIRIWVIWPSPKEFVFCIYIFIKNKLPVGVQVFLKLRRKIRLSSFRVRIVNESVQTRLSPPAWSGPNTLQFQQKLRKKMDKKSAKMKKYGQSGQNQQKLTKIDKIDKEWAKM